MALVLKAPGDTDLPAPAAVTAAEPIAASAKPSESSGLACLVLVARHHGLDLTVSQIVHDNVLSSRDVSLAESRQMREVGRPEGEARAVRPERA